MWVVVTHIVSPNNFYVRYIAERRESEALSKKINQYCWRDSCRFVFGDMLEMGVCVLFFPSLSLFFFKTKVNVLISVLRCSLSMELRFLAVFWFGCTHQGSMIFAKWAAGVWCRATIAELKQHGCAEPVKFCWVNSLVNIKVFFIDNGLTKSISLLRWTRAGFWQWLLQMSFRSASLALT